MTPAQAFAARVHDPRRLEAIDPEVLGAALALVASQGRAAWRDLGIEDEVFAVYLAERLPEDGDVTDALATMPAADLYLACGCARGRPAAIEAFEKRYFGEVDAVLARVRSPGVSADDVKQMLREKLFVGSADAPPRIGEYGGKGALASWFRVTTTRLALNLTRGPKEVPADDERILEVPGGVLDQELEHLKSRYSAEFKAAFASTFARLEARERALLRYTLTDGLASDEIALVYGVHRTTVNRWLSDLRDAIAKGVRVEMAQRLGVNKAELESIMRLIRSRIEITLAGIKSGQASGRV
jgi:RNA polymerase sigma-70 factor (ECF subfamily)